MKRVQRNQEIDRALQSAFGDADIGGLAVFEMVAANVNAIRKKAGLYAGARFSEGTLGEMAQLINAESRQLILNHDTSQMPVGRAFAGKMHGEELRALFAINGATQANLISDVEAGIVDQVSVSILPKRLLCSECGWDYMGDSATSDNFWDCTCGNGHTIGENGTHVRISGVEAFTEISLCGMGAVPGARVVDRAHSAFSGVRLAAGVDPTILVLNASLDKPKDTPEMDLTAVMARIEALAAENAAFKLEVEGLKAAAVISTQTIATLTAEKSALEAAAKPADAATIAAQAADNVALRAAVEDMTKRSLVATGESGVALATDVAGLVAQLTGAQTKLSALIPSGARSKPADAVIAPAMSPTANRGFLSAQVK